MNIPNLQELMAQNLNNKENCNSLSNPLDPVFNVLQGKWKNQVLFEIIALKNARFGQLSRAIPKITNTMLSTTLRQLEKDGLLQGNNLMKSPHMLNIQ